VARLLFQQLLLAVDYIHKMGVANRDIKLENVLLGGPQCKPSAVLKLTDFGLCKHDTDSMAKTFCGTPLYMGEAPPYASACNDFVVRKPVGTRLLPSWHCHNRVTS
jgi:serine/threonine-protein kinase SRK2